MRRGLKLKKEDYTFGFAESVWRAGCVRCVFCETEQKTRVTSTKRLRLFWGCLFICISVIRVGIRFKFTLIIQLSFGSVVAFFSLLLLLLPSVACNLFKDELYNFQMSFYFFFSSFVTPITPQRILCSKSQENLCYNFFIFLVGFFHCGQHTHTTKPILAVAVKQKSQHQQPTRRVWLIWSDKN